MKISYDHKTKKLTIEDVTSRFLTLFYYDEDYETLLIKAKSGDDESLFKFIALFPEDINAYWVKDRLKKAGEENDREFIENYEKAIKETPKIHRNTELALKAVIIDYYLSERSSVKLSPKKLMHLFLRLVLPPEYEEVTQEVGKKCSLEFDDINIPVEDHSIDDIDKLNLLDYRGEIDYAIDIEKFREILGQYSPESIKKYVQRFRKCLNESLKNLPRKDEEDNIFF